MNVRVPTQIIALAFGLGLGAWAAERESVGGVRYYFYPSVVEGELPSPAIFRLGVRSDEPMFVAGTILFDPALLWVDRIDCWDSAQSTYRTVYSHARPLDNITIEPMFVCGEPFAQVRVFIENAAHMVSSVVSNGEIRCRLNVPLLAYDGRRKQFVTKMHVYSTPFNVRVKDGRIESAVAVGAYDTSAHVGGLDIGEHGGGNTSTFLPWSALRSTNNNGTGSAVLGVDRTNTTHSAKRGVGSPGGWGGCGSRRSRGR